MKNLFIVAEILRPHGRRGEVVLRPMTDHPETLTDAREVYLGQDSPEKMEIEGIRFHKGSPLLKLAGVDDMNAALALKGKVICRPGEELVPLEEGEYFLHDLVGLTVLDHLGNRVGRVEYILETGGPPLLNGTRTDGEEFIVPFASGTIDEVDLERSTIRLVDLPGLLD